MRMFVCAVNKTDALHALAVSLFKFSKLSSRLSDFKRTISTEQFQ